MSKSFLRLQGTDDTNPTIFVKIDGIVKAVEEDDLLKLTIVDSYEEIKLEGKQKELMLAYLEGDCRFIGKKIDGPLPSSLDVDDTEDDDKNVDMDNVEGSVSALPRNGAPKGELTFSNQPPTPTPRSKAKRSK